MLGDLFIHILILITVINKFDGTLMQAVFNTGNGALLGMTWYKFYKIANS